MKDREKQVEEMAKECKNCIHEDTCWLGIVDENCKYYQPKLPEDSVVLSNEEFEKITKELITEQRAKEIAQEYFGIVRKEMAEKIWNIAKAIVDSTKHIVQGREYLHLDALKEIIKSCGVEIK